MVTSLHAAASYRVERRTSGEPSYRLTYQILAAVGLHHELLRFDVQQLSAAIHLKLMDFSCFGCILSALFYHADEYPY